jgi:hypothetical protein
VTEKGFHLQSNSSDHVEQQILNLKSLKPCVKRRLIRKAISIASVFSCGVPFFARNMEHWDRRFACHCVLPASVCESKTDASRKATESPQGDT